MNRLLNIETLIHRFQEIENSTPLRKEKLRKLDELYQSVRDNPEFTSEEILNLTKALLQRDVMIKQSFFSDAIYPLLSQQIEQGDVEAIKLMVKLEQQLIAYQGMNKDYRYTAHELIIKGLQLRPDDTELLQAYEIKTGNYLSYTIHEVPLGIIYDTDGTTDDQHHDLMALVNEYERVCFKLGIDRSELIEDCRYFYTLYHDYLKVCSSYDGFKDYLIKNKHRTT